MEGSIELNHFFLKLQNTLIHVVVFHQVKHFLWIDRIPEEKMSQLDGFNIHYGKHEQLFDQFRLTQIDSVKFPDEVDYFLSQFSTSQFNHCPPESYYWLSKNRIEQLVSKVNSSTEAIISMKSLMKQLNMQFWIACGTLLGE